MATMDSKRGFPTFGMTSNPPLQGPVRPTIKPANSVWGSTSSVWGNGNAIGSGKRTGVQDSARTNDFASSSPITDVTGSGSLLPSSELDHQTGRSNAWKTGEDLSPGLPPGGLSPLARQQSGHSIAPIFGDDAAEAPYFSITAAPDTRSTHQSQQNFLDPTTGSFVSGMGDPLGGLGRSSRQNSEDNDVYAARGVFSGKDTGTVMHSSRAPVKTSISGYNSGAASRSGSQPPSRNDGDQAYRQRAPDVRNAPYTRSGPMTTAAPSSSSFRSTAANAAPFVMSTGTNAAPSASSYIDNLSPSQIDHLAHYFDRLQMTKGEMQNSQASHGQRSETSASYGNPYTAGDGLHNQMDRQHHGHRPGQVSPPGPEFHPQPSNSAYYRPQAFDSQHNYTSDMMNSRMSQQAPYYPSAGTPPVHGQRGPTRQHYNGVPAGQAAILEQKLQGLQRQQQMHNYGVLPSPSHMHFQGQMPNAYEMQAHPGLRMNLMNSYYPMAPAPHMLNGHHIPRGPARDHDAAQQVRSPLLEDFRNNSKTNKRYELKDIYHHIVEFSGDQHGSRFIQQKLETANSDEKEQVFKELHPNSRQLMTDVFGNYVIQKFFEHGNQAQKKMLANQMRNHVLTLSMQIYGCRVVQKALEHILTDQQAELVKELNNDVMKCVKDQNGNHVVQKAIERVPAEHIQFIISVFTGRVQESATHAYGCRVVQRMLEFCEEPTKQAVLRELHDCAISLIVDQYGNYVTQHVIEHGKPEDRAKLISLVTMQLVNYSRHKFASNVVEKSIQFGSLEQRQAMVAALSVTNDKGDSPIQALIRDQYGNYVIQKLITQLRGPEYDEFIEAIKVQISLLKRFSFGNGKQIAAVEKVLYTDAYSPIQPHHHSGFSSAYTESAVPTPALTTGDAQSPQSNSGPSTHDSSVDVSDVSRKSSNSHNLGFITPALVHT